MTADKPRLGGSHQAARRLRRIGRHLRRHGLLREDPDEDQDPEANLAVSAVSGQTPPAGPQWQVRLAPLERRPLAYDKPLCASQDGFTLHAATRAGALDVSGREALLRYVLRPPIAQDKVEPQTGSGAGMNPSPVPWGLRRNSSSAPKPPPDGLIRIVLKRPYADGTVAVDLDPLSLLARLAACVPPPRHHTVRYSGVLAAASPWRSRIAPIAEPQAPKPQKKRQARYRPWAELLWRTLGVDALACPTCSGRMRLVALIRSPLTVAWHLARIGEPTELPERAADRGPPYWASTILRRKARGYQEA